MRASNSLAPTAAPQQKNVPFSVAINAPAMQATIKNAISDPKRAASFTATLISAVASNERLRACNPNSLVSAALRGEAMDLNLALGQYSIVPYGELANFQISYKGVSQLAIRSGQYVDLGVYEVREGEYKGRDVRTRQPLIAWIDDEDEREKLPIIGYYGFYELKSGFFQSVYWTHDKILNHADKYSQAFSKDLWLSIWGPKGDLSKAQTVKGKSPWYDAPDAESHMKMCKKTLLLQMLTGGLAPLSLEMQEVMKTDASMEQGNGVISMDDPVVVAKNASRKEVSESQIVDMETGEIIEDATTSK